MVDENSHPEKETNAAITTKESQQTAVVLDYSPASLDDAEPKQSNFNSQMDSENNSAEDSSIRAYLLELTNYLVTEVCRRISSD